MCKAIVLKLFLLEINTVQQRDPKCQSTLFDRDPNQPFMTSLRLLEGTQLCRPSKQTSQTYPF